MAFSFLKTGAAADAEGQKAEALRQAKMQANTVPFRFWLEQGSKRLITFLDGDLREDGSLNPVCFHEHNLKLNGKFGNFFACTKDDEPCPICEGGNQPSLTYLFTVIDHTPYQSKQNKLIVNQRKLFACKPESFKYLQDIAKKRGGLRGVTFEVMRTGDKSAAVGSHFDFEQKRSVAEVAKAYNLKPEEVQPFDYEKAVVFRTAAELRQMGFGTAPLGAGDVPPPVGTVAQAGPSEDQIAQQL